MSIQPNISFFEGVQQPAQYARVEAAKAKLELALKYFFALRPEEMPELQHYCKLTKEELSTLIMASARNIEVMGADYSEAAVKLGWLQYGREWYEAHPKLSIKLGEVGKLVHFYALLNYLKTQKQPA